MLRTQSGDELATVYFFIIKRMLMFFHMHTFFLIYIYYYTHSCITYAAHIHLYFTLFFFLFFGTKTSCASNKPLERSNLGQSLSHSRDTKRGVVGCTPIN